jgi:predicted phosphodiesterase
VRLAVISDVHGNRLALDAVLDDIAREGADAVVCLGDHVSGPLDPAGSAERLMGLDGPVIRGIHDRWLVDRQVKALDPVDRFALMRLKASHRAWLEAMPATATIGEDVFLCHGTPTSDNTVWLDNYWYDRQTTLPSEPGIERQAAGVNYPVILCGHTHVARSVRLRDGRLIVNPGSVGLQIVHGSPDARYAIVERRDGQWFSSIRMVPYAHDAAAEQARANGFAGWVEAIAPGWANPEGLF